VKRASLVVGLIVALSSVLAASPAEAAPVHSLSHFQGKSVSELSELWWQWAGPMPSGQSALDDTTGARCELGDMGKIFFLAGIAGQSTVGNPLAPSVVRSCTIRSGTAIFAPLLNLENAIGTDCLGTQAECVKTTVETIDQVTVSGTTAQLDGALIQPVRTFATDFFQITIADPNPFPATPGTFSAVADGYYVLLPPLSVGAHTLHLKGDFANGFFTVDVLYHLTVVPRGRVR
jgi:hypothetical protein